MAYISEDKKQEILEKASLQKILESYHGNGKKKGVNIAYDCPKCGTKDKLEYNAAKDIAKCFKCDIGVKNPVNYLTKFKGNTYKQALEELAKLELIELPETKPKVPFKKRVQKDTYCAKMLKESGLTVDDITSEVYVDDATKKQLPNYQPGTLDERYEITTGDDVIIHYFDLEGKPMCYYRKHKNGNVIGKPKNFFRIRYQNPSLHVDKNGNSVKYRSPYGSGSKLYIPKAVRRKYQTNAVIETLYIQEGEKKADKATKHGIISVGVMGIHNIASNKRMPKEFELIIKRCQVKNIVFVLDADWQNLGHKIDSKHAADQRPKSFFTAVKNFRNHFYAFTNNDIYLNIFFAHVKENIEKDKGIDDLLTNSLRGKEKDLKTLCNDAIIDPKGDAKWIQFYNITTVSEFKLLSHWGLQNKDEFVHKYRETLQKYPEFKYGRMKWRFNKEGDIELAQPLLDHEQFWNIDDSGKKTNYSFNHTRCYNFLQARGFGRLQQPNNNYIWMRTEESVVKQVEVHQIRDFVINFTKQLNKEDVLNMLYRGGPKYFGPDSMGNLDYTAPTFHQSAKGLQYLYFNDKYWKITADEIIEDDIKNLAGSVWIDQIKDFSPKKLPSLFKELHQVTEQDAENNIDLKPYIGEWTVEFSKDGEKCHFLQFLLNTSNFNNIKKRALSDLSLTETFETTRHLLSKITTMGYLLHRYRDSGLLKAVICMDGKMSEVGLSNGRSGKSLIGEAIRKLIPTVYIGGKKKDLTDDRFKWEEVDERTQCVFIDDIRTHFDFESLFPEITGDFQIEGKGIKRYTLHRSVAPKILITTNHAIKGEGSSFKDRQILLGFSDHYNDNHKPIDDFGVLFFDEWSESQWNLFYNLGAFSLHTYFKYGLISAPTGQLEKRRLRQEIGEMFLDWADEYFSKAHNLRNKKLDKSLMYNGTDPLSGDGFVIKYPREKMYTNITKFKRKLKNYCKYKDWQFNPSATIPGGDIKTAGKEYIEIWPPTQVYDAIVRQTSIPFSI